MVSFFSVYNNYYINYIEIKRPIYLTTGFVKKISSSQKEMVTVIENFDVSIPSTMHPMALSSPIMKQ